MSADMAQAPSADHDAAEARVWHNSTIRDLICQFSSIGTLARIARVDQASFDTAVRLLWEGNHFLGVTANPNGSHEHEQQLMLNAIDSPDRYYTCCRSVRTICVSQLNRPGIAPLLFRYPSLRHISLGCIRGDDHNVRAIMWTGVAPNIAVELYVEDLESLVQIAIHPSSAQKKLLAMLPRHWDVRTFHVNDSRIQSAADIDLVEKITAQYALNIDKLQIGPRNIPSHDMEKILDLIGNPDIRCSELKVCLAYRPPGSPFSADSGEGDWSIQRVLKVISVAPAYSVLDFTAKIPYDDSAFLQIVEACRTSRADRIRLRFQMTMGLVQTKRYNWCDIGLSSFTELDRDLPGAPCVELDLHDVYDPNKSPILRTRRSSDILHWVARLARMCVSVGGMRPSYDMTYWVSPAEGINGPHLWTHGGQEHAKIDGNLRRQIPQHFQNTIRNIAAMAQASTGPGWRRIGPSATS